MMPPDDEYPDDEDVRDEDGPEEATDNARLRDEEERRDHSQRMSDFRAEMRRWR